jgi:hypothetical protein
LQWVQICGIYAAAKDENPSADPGSVAKCEVATENQDIAANGTADKDVAGEDANAPCRAADHLDGTQKTRGVTKRLILRDEKILAEMDCIRLGAASQHQGTKNKTPWKHASVFYEG